MKRYTTDAKIQYLDDAVVPDQFPGTVVDEGGAHASQDDEEQGHDGDHVRLREQLAQDTGVSLEQSKTMQFGNTSLLYL